MPSTLEIRPIAAGDEDAWRRLWQGYLAFYETALPERVYASTWRRLTDGEPHDPKGLIAVRDGTAIGLAHYILHRHCWRVENICYLNDLYADPAVRGTGVGRALVEAVYAAADRAGCPHVYWMTKASNETARRLYDRIGKPTPFIEYQR